MSDFVLNLAKNKEVKNQFKKIGIRLPTPLNRDSLAYRKNMFSSDKCAVFTEGKLSSYLNEFIKTENIVCTTFEKDKNVLQNFEVLKYDDKLRALIFDATSTDLKSTLDDMYKFFHLYISLLESTGRVILLVSNENPILKASVLGFMRSLQKELGPDGSTVNTICIEDMSFLEERVIDDSLSYLLSRKSSFVTGQVFNVTRKKNSVGLSHKFLDGKICVVTGASRGIGFAICKTFAKEGAHVIGVDLPALREDLEKNMNSIGASSYFMDVSKESEYAGLKDFIASKGNLDVIIHNAGITRDGIFKKMSYKKWESVLDINLYSIMAMNNAFEDLFTDNSKMVLLSSIAGLAGKLWAD